MTDAVLLTDRPTGASASGPGDALQADPLVALMDDLSDVLGPGCDPTGALELVRRHPAAFPLPGTGATPRLWEALASVAAVSLTAARAIEPHLDALAILAEAQSAGHGVTDLTDLAAERGTWGVYAAEGPGVRLEAEPAGDAFRLHGTKPWCSLAGSLSHALVTAWDSPATRRLYAVRLGEANGVTVHESAWFARGLAAVPSGPVSFDGSEAVPVGPAGWYLERPGFAWGGMGVAAIWYGGAVGVARRLSRAGREPDQVALMHLGAVEATLWATRTTLLDAAARVDDGRATGPEGAALALRVRHAASRAAEAVLERVGHATGPAPLALEEEHAGRVADLQLYVRQEHAERDEAALGRLVLSEKPHSWW